MSFIVRENVPLAPLTTLKIGGRARYFVQISQDSEIIEAFEFAQTKNLEVFVLGGGSNVLIADEGYDGLVLQVAIKGISKIGKDNETVLIKAGAGEDWDSFCAFCVEKNFQGVECLSGIPGFVGGTPVQNVGAYGQEVAETIFKVNCFDRKKRTFVEMTNSDCKFHYRSSIFNTSEKNRFIVTSVVYALQSGGAPKIAYRDLLNYFGDAKISLKELRAAVLKIRAEKSMVVDENDPNSNSAGSFFKNPIISINELREIEKIANKSAIKSVPFYEIDQENVKIPAAWLIENSGFHKGYNLGNAGISTKHSLAIINRGNATANEIIHLKNQIQIKVKEKFNVVLYPEPIFVGFKGDELK